MSILADDICIWDLAKPAKGIAPQAFSWWDCKGSRNYGIPVDRICHTCGNTIRIRSEIKDENGTDRS